MALVQMADDFLHNKKSFLPITYGEDDDKSSNKNKMGMS